MGEHKSPCQKSARLFPSSPRCCLSLALKLPSTLGSRGESASHGHCFLHGARLPFFLEGIHMLFPHSENQLGEERKGCVG